MNVVRAALRGDEFDGICCPAAKVVFAVRADAEVGRVSIEPCLDSGLERVAARRENDDLAALKEVSIGLHHRAGGGVERLEEAIDELDRWIGAIGCGKSGCGAGNAERRHENEAGRDVARPGADDIALPVDVRGAKGRINGRLVWIRGGAGQVVDVEACEELVFSAQGVVETEGKLIGVGDDAGGGCVSVRAKGTRRVVGQRVAPEDSGNTGSMGT